METIEKINILDAKIEGIIDIISNKSDTAVNSLDIKSFLEKYSIYKSLLKSDTLHSMVESINELNKKIKNIETEVNVPLEIAKNETNKIIAMYGDDNTQLALNMADIKLLKSSIYKTFKDLILYISDLKIDEKIVSLNSNIELAKEMTNSIAQQKDKIDTIIKTIEVQETVIENVEKKNEIQDTQISYANDLIVTMEKQIESYAFFAEEFNNIYMVARDFVKNFTKLEREMEHIYKRDNALLAMIENIVAFIEKDYRKISNTIDHIDNLFETYAKEIISWTTESMMFVNEVKGYNLSLAAYNDKFDDISSMLDNVLNNISKIKEGK